jgi:hypothetical protein
LKEQRKYDDMVSALTDGLARVLPFATLALEEVVCDETELLDRAVRRMCILIADAANFICAYTKQYTGGTLRSIILFPDSPLSSSSREVGGYGYSYQNQGTPRRLCQAEGRF